MPGISLIPINLNEFQFETGGLNIIVENKLQPFKNTHEWMRKVGLLKKINQCFNL